MSCKLLPGGAQASAIQWSACQTVGRPDIVVPHQRAPQTAAPVESGTERIAELEREAAARQEAAYRRGFAEGQAAAGAQAAARVDPVLAKLAGTIAELGRVRERVRAEAEQDIVHLAVAIAQRVLRREIATDQDVLSGILKAALSRLDARELHSVRVHPEDVPAIERHLAAAGAPPRVQLSADPSLERGSAIFETSHGNLDASITTQLREIERGLADMARRH